MRRYVENVPPSLTQKELHDRAYALLYRVLQDEWGIASPIVEKTPLGKPYLKGENMPHISLSHTKGIVCCAVSRKNVGIDAEYPRRVRGVPQSASVRPQSFWIYKAAPIPPRAFWRTGRSKRASPSAAAPAFRNRSKTTRSPFKTACRILTATRSFSSSTACIFSPPPRKHKA